MATSNQTFGDFSLWQNGPQPGNIYNFPGQSTSSGNDTRQRTVQPMTTGTSVLGVKFDGGVMLAADMLGSYGSTARFRGISRVMKVNASTVLTASGDYADFQYLKSIMEQKVIEENCLDDGFKYTPQSIFSWMTRVLYQRRSHQDPLWNTYIVGGLNDSKPFLGYIDKLGTAYEANAIASGFGQYIALPILRELVEQKPLLTQQEAREAIVKCMRILFYRDARSFNKFEIVTVTKDGVVIEPPQSAETNWNVAHFVKGFN
ncbi:PREDICTED: proteasome subunit beta type-4-like [Priapulus caudatus]|uniref:Proteasome subunit beta n=1 Tax=Priapulus caudatus TaxID=37621 RepID=A0ABM1EJD3_PRICU|nr:PREDICTED: proteasome subunit beta type-4-like [Priapulus caudatus]